MGKRRSKGEGSIFWSESEKVWIAQIDLPDGKRKRKRNKLQKVVRAWLEEQKAAVREGVWISKDTVTVGEFVDRYMEEVAAHTLRPKSIESYTYQVEKHIKPALGSYKLTQLRPDHLQHLYSEKLKDGFSKRTVQYMHAVIHKMLNTAIKWGLVARNVADGVNVPTPEKSKIEPLTVDQVKRLYEVLEGDRFKAFFILAASTGLRRGELLALKKSSIDLETGTVTVKENLVQIKGKVVLGEPKSEASRRVVALPEIAIEALREHLENHNGKSDYLFCTSNGTLFSPRNVFRHFKKLLKKAGLPETVRIHDLRHSFISWLLASGVPPKDVQVIAGHSQFSTTLDQYAHVMPGYDKKAASKIDDLFK